MTVEFRPTVKSINIASEDLTKITLEVKNDSLNGKYDELRKFSNKTVSVLIIPETYSFIIPFDKSTNAATLRYEVESDGTVNLVKEEQVQLDVDGKGNVDIFNKSFSIEKDVIDDYILNAPNIKFPGEINPREVLSQLEDEVSLSEIADYFEMSETTLLTELEHARTQLAPFAHAWNTKKEAGEITGEIISTISNDESNEVVEQEGDTMVTNEQEQIEVDREEPETAADEAAPY